jgi:hypothetical protein
MNAQSMRHRRLLSGVRRTGLQIDPQVARGISARHAQGWKDQQYDDIEGDGLRMLRTAVVGGIAVWAMFGLLLWWAVSLLAA